MTKIISALALLAVLAAASASCTSKNSDKNHESEEQVLIEDTVVAVTDSLSDSVQTVVEGVQSSEESVNR